MRGALFAFGKDVTHEEYRHHLSISLNSMRIFMPDRKQRQLQLSSRKIDYFHSSFVDTDATSALKASDIVQIIDSSITEDDTITLDGEMYYCLLVECNDSCDTRTIPESVEEENGKDDQRPSDNDTSVRSGRRSTRPPTSRSDSEFIFY